MILAQNSAVPPNRRRARANPPAQTPADAALVIDQQLVAARTQFSRAVLAAMRGAVDAEHQVQEALALIEQVRREVLRLVEPEGL